MQTSLGSLQIDFFLMDICLDEQIFQVGMHLWHILYFGGFIFLGSEGVILMFSMEWKFGFYVMSFLQSWMTGRAFKFGVKY